MTQDSFRFPAITSDLDRLISTARQSKSLSSCARRILEVLCDPRTPHIGKASAISIAELQSIWMQLWSESWSDREIKASVKELIEAHNILIGSSRQEPYGYYVCNSLSDIEAATAPHKSQIISEVKRLMKFGYTTDYVRHLVGQAELE